MLFLLTQRKIVFGLLLALALGAVFISFILNPGERTVLTITQEAGATHLANVKGWAWANTPQSAGDPQTGTDQGLGWISFNSLNCDSDDDTLSDGGPPGCPPAGTVIPQYGVFVDPATGTFSGHAWIGEESPSGAGSVGWVSFNPGEFGSGCPDPDGTCEQARVSTTGPFPRVIDGWARVLSLKDPQNDLSGATSEGWIHLSDPRTDLDSSTGLQHPIYQTRIMNQEGEIRGWTWGSDMLGWISFACGSDPTCSTTIPGNPSTDAFDPTPRNLTTSLDTVDEGDYCQETFGGGTDRITFDWTSAANTFILEVDRSGDTSFTSGDDTWSVNLTGSGAVVDRATVIPSATSGYTSITGCSTATCTFNWRVSADGGTTWSPGTFSLTSHDWPLVRFTRDKLNVEINESVTFTDTSTCYDGGAHACSNTAGDTFAWTFEDGTIILPSTSTSKDPTVQFGEPTNDAKEIVHAVDDGHAHTCTQNSQIIVGTLIPGWKEITP